MVLSELGGRISSALHQMNKAMFIDEKVLMECLNEISRALMAADVQFKLIRAMQANIKKIVNLDEVAVGHNKRKIIEQAVFNELCNMLEPGKPAFIPKKGKTNIIMFVGLQGVGKTTTCTKYAHHYQKKGWKTALICADAFRAGAYDQLKQNAAKAKIPFYGSYMETDPVKLAQDGIKRFKKENCDMIIVDTSGRHKQQTSLFEEMRQLADVTNPDLVIFVMDSTIGQTAFDQAQAFKHSVDVGAVIVAKMDGHAKGGGALSAVAATKSPIIFIGTGEHMDEFEVFETKYFVRRLLGMGDWSGLVDEIQEVVPMEQQHDLVQQLIEGNISLRLMYGLFHNILSTGNLSQIQSMLLGDKNGTRLSQELMPKGQEKERSEKIRKHLIMMDSMTNKELDSPNWKLMNESRMHRVARGSGRSFGEVHEMLKECKQLAKSWSNMKGLNIPKKGNMSTMSRNLNAQQISKVIPPHMLKQIGGVGCLQALVKQMGWSQDLSRTQ